MMRSLVVGLVLLSCVAWVVPSALAGDAKVEVGKKAPDFFLRDREGIMHRLSDMAFEGKESHYRKKSKILIDFFRTDCKPCMKELPEVIKFHEKHKGEVRVLLIALLEEENGRAKLDQFLKTNKLPFPVLVDAYETVAKKYIVKGDTVSLPSIFLIDKTGNVLAKLEGLEKDLEAALVGSLAPAKKAG